MAATSAVAKRSDVRRPDEGARMPSLIHHSLSPLIAIAVAAGYLYHYYWLFLARTEASGQLHGYYEAIANGNASAPYQYRILTPMIVTALHRATGASYATIALIVDGAALYAGGLFVWLMLRDVQRAWALPWVALFIAWWGMNNLTGYWKPETFTAFAAVCAWCWLYLCEDRIAWARTWQLVPAAVLALTRPDMLFVLGAAAYYRWLRRRDRRDRVAGAGSLFAAAASLLILAMLVYPDAKYPPGVSVFQLADNLHSFGPLILVAYLGPLALALRVGRRLFPQRFAIEFTGLCLALALFTILSVVVGRAEEIRVWFPFSGFIGVILAVVTAPETAASTASTGQTTGAL